MRILVDIGHPAHVHFFRHPLRRWAAEGYEVMITAREKDVALQLLDHFGLSYTVLSSVGNGGVRLLAEFVRREWRLWTVLRTFKPHVVTAIGGAFIAPVCRLSGVPSVVFTDTEDVTLDRFLTYPLATRVCTPMGFRRSAGPRQQRYAGLQELAYLHPRYFRPNPDTLDDFALSPGEPFSLIRFVAWGAGHDVGQRGLGQRQRRRLVRELAQHGRVLISAEAQLPGDLQPYQITSKPQMIHDLMHYASIYVGEGTTMATEAALLGTPSILINSRVGTLGFYSEVVELGLVQAFQDEDRGVDRALALLQDPQAQARQQRVRRKVIEGMVDVSAFVADVVPETAHGSGHNEDASPYRPVDAGGESDYKRVYNTHSSSVDS